MVKGEIFKLFNKTYFEFLQFIQKYLKDDSNFKMFYRKNLIVRETNVKIIINTWYSRITQNYYDKVMNKDFDFFLNKSYEGELTKSETQTPLLKYISDFKNLFPSLEESIKEEFLQFILNLTELSYLYYKN